jgi:predicted TIM-barrel fold metal-dependent hydrolase
MTAPGQYRSSWLTFPVYSADSHVVEPPDLWTQRIARRFRDRAPRVVSFAETDLWVVEEGDTMAVVGIQAQAGRRYNAEDHRRITKRGFYRDILDLTADRYVAELMRDGVSGAVLFPSNAHQAYRCIGGDLLAAVAQIYNDWVLDYCRARPAELKPVAMLAIDDLRTATAEMERTAAAGAVGMLIPILPAAGRRFDQPAYDRLWRAAASLHMPLLMHVGANQAVRGREPTIDLVRHATKDVHVRASLATLVLSGVFARHPNLRVGAVEFGASWMVDLANQLDRVYMARRPDPGASSLPTGELPSDHVVRNVAAIFQQDRAAIEWRHLVGLGNLLWGNDFPHAESTFPRSHEVLAEDLRDVPVGEVRQILCDNAVEMFGFDSDAASPGAAPWPRDSGELKK